MAPASSKIRKSSKLVNQTANKPKRQLLKMYEVEKMIAKRTVSVTQWLLKWKGFSDEEATWEYEDDLISSCRDLMGEFDAKNSVSPETITADLQESDTAPEEEERSEEGVTTDSVATSSTNEITVNPLDEIPTTENKDEVGGTDPDAHNEEEIEFLRCGRWTRQPSSSQNWQKIINLASDMGLSAVVNGDGELIIEKTYNRTRKSLNVLDQDCQLKIIGGTDEGGVQALLELKNQRTGVYIQAFLPVALVRIQLPDLWIDYLEKHIKFAYLNDNN